MRNAKYFAITIFLLINWAPLGTAHAEFSPTIYIDLSEEKPQIYSYVNEKLVESVIGCRGLNDLTESHVPVPECSSNRSYLGKGDVLTVAVKHPDAFQLSVTFDEVKRESRIRGNLDSLAKIVDSILARAADGPLPTYEYVTTHRRSVIEVTAELINPANSSVAQSISTKIIVGPEENWFVSADILVSQVDQLKYNTETMELSPRDKPSQFHIGFNYQLSDILAAPVRLTDRLHLKLLVSASSRPLDSYGYGLGYMVNDALSVFAVMNRFLEDDVTPDGQPKRNSQRREELRFGISVSLDSALSWLSK